MKEKVTNKQPSGHSYMHTLVGLLCIISLVILSHLTNLCFPRLAIHGWNSIVRDENGKAWWYNEVVVITQLPILWPQSFSRLLVWKSVKFAVISQFDKFIKKDNVPREKVGEKESHRIVTSALVLLMNLFNRIKEVIDLRDYSHKQMQLYMSGL